MSAISAENFTGNAILALVRALYPYAYSIVAEANDLALPVYLSELEFNVLEFPTGAEVNGWRVPPAWIVRKARISRGDCLLWDSTSSPLSVGALSPSFSGLISREDLKTHLFFSKEMPTSVPYHWSNLYRPAENSWAFCVTKYFYDDLQDGFYSVDLETEYSRGTMKVLDFLLPGQSKKTILINAHNCHPYQANDDISGCAVAIKLMQYLKALPQRKYSYRLIIAPELVGPVHWLESIGLQANSIEGAILLKAVGNPAALKLQHSFSGNSQLDKAAVCVLRDRFGSFESGAFRTLYGNDETAFDSPGYKIPSISLTRFPFKQYHTDADTPESLDPERLRETFEILVALVDALESNSKLFFSKRGLVSLSNPKYSLYKSASAPGLDKEPYDELQRRWNLFMNCLPRELDGSKSAVDLAYAYDLPLMDVCEYLDQWRERGLAEPVRGK